MKKKKIKSLKINKLQVSHMNPELLKGGLRRSDWTDLSECCNPK